MTEQSFRSGFVALVGRPNVGKSTLMNALLGQKVAIVTPKPQTTRDRILGIRTDEESQLVFLDTPGIHESKKALNRAMVDTALRSMAEADVVVFMVDATEQVRAIPEDADLETLKPPEVDLNVLRFVREAAIPTILVVNKIDRVKKKHLLLPVLGAWQRQHPFVTAIPISALVEEGLDRVMSELRSRVPEGPKFYEDDMLTDRSKRFLVAEIVREKVFLRTQREIPYAVAVEIEQFHRQRSVTEIHAAIHVERASQKAILVGRGGAMIKAIGTDARRDIEDLLERKVMLRLFVHVEQDWTQKRRGLQRFGYVDE